MRLVRYRGKWCAYYRDDAGRPRRISLGTADREEAERRLRDVERHQEVARPRETVGEIVEAWLRDKEMAGQSAPKAVSNARYAWNKAAPTFAHLHPHHVTRGLTREYSEQRQAEGLSPATIRQHLITLQTALRWHDPQTPAVVEMPAPPPPRERHLSRDEAERLIEASKPTPHLYAFVILALTTAARGSALLELTWDRVDLDRGVIDLGPGAGTKRRAVVPINATARDALVRQREAALTDHVIEYAGKRVKSIKKAFGRACKRAGLEDVSPHTLRHTAAVWMAESGVPMSEISQYLGHTSTAVTERVYARYSPDYLQGAASALELGACSSEHGETRIGRAGERKKRSFSRG